MKISVCISTHGGESWSELAVRRAKPSVDVQNPYEVIVKHLETETLAQARNEAASETSGDYIVFLDADDELAPGYLDAMQRAWERSGGDNGTTRMFPPSTSYIRGGRVQAPRFWPEVPIARNNWLVIGTMVPRDLFLEVGGFREYGWSEDWGLFCALSNAGVEIVKVPDAVYRAHFSVKSRNRRADRAEMHYWHQRIGHDYFPHIYDAPTEAEDAEHKLHGRPLLLRRNEDLIGT